ncbi:MAG: hypothetical protein M5U12_14490 [Verrucomicrobia bacterium]|nr:hypothetical protein [Verrucomicrobiota bacterium]
MLVENAKFAWRFFPPEIARSPAPTVLAAAKPPVPIACSSSESPRPWGIPDRRMGSVAISNCS